MECVCAAGRTGQSFPCTSSAIRSSYPDWPVGSGSWELNPPTSEPVALNTLFYFLSFNQPSCTDYFSSLKKTAYRRHVSLRTLCLQPPQAPLTVFLSSSSLQSQPVGQPRARKFVSGGTAAREASRSGGSGASALTLLSFLFFSLTADPRLLFQARPLQRGSR